MNKDDFWNDKQKSEEVIAEVNELKNSLDSVSSLKNKIDNN